MRSFFAFLAALLVSFTSAAQSFPPSPKVLVAVNPITNKVYIANESANTVTVLNGATNTSTTIPVGSRPQFIVVNPLTNRVFVNNGGEASLTVIDGATDTNLTPTPLAVGSQGPMAVNTESNIVYIVRMTSLATDEVTFFDASNNTWYTIATESFQPTALTINPVTNKLYVAHYGTGDVRVISGASDGNAHPATFSVGAWSKPFAIAANSMTNKVYVITEDSRGPIGIIDGATNNAVFPLPAAGHASGPKALAVNPATNRIYAAFAGEVVVIDGNTNGYTYVPVNTGSGPASIGINYFTNKIYVSSSGGTLTIIDGGTNATTTVAIPAGVASLGVNAMTNEVYVAGDSPGIVPGATGPFIGTPLLTNINPLPGNSSASTGSITMSASNGYSNPLPIRGVYFQLDSMDGAWSPATGSGPYTASFSGLAAGSHMLYAFAAEGHIAPTDTGPQGNPLFGTIASYGFTVSGTLADATVGLATSQNPASVGQSVTFTATVTGAGSPPTGTVRFADGATTIAGCTAVAIASGKATCTTTTLAAGSHTITASYSGSSSYNPASANITQTVNKSNPSVTLSTSANAVETGQNVTLTAAVAGSFGAPTGTVAFFDGGTAVAGCAAVALTSASASCTASFSSVGRHAITARYAGNAAYNAITSATVNIDVSAPLGAPPTTISPSGTVTTASPAYTWNAKSGATSYDLLIQTPAGADVYLANFTAAAAGCPAGTGTCSITPSFALANGSSYNWFVRARNSASVTGWSAYRAINAAFAVAPAEPTTVSPTGTVATTTPTFVWNAVGDAASYDLLLQTPGGADVFLTNYSPAAAGCGAGSGTCSITPANAVANGKSYNWFVRAKNANGASGWSPARAITIDAGPGQTVPAAPMLSSPRGTIPTTTPTYSWSASSGAASYNLILQDRFGTYALLSFSADAAGCSAGTGMCSVMPSTALVDGNQYNWAVNASNAAGTSGWSNSFTITVATSSTPPATPTLGYPSGNVPTRTPTFYWSASSGATSYDLILQSPEGTFALLSYSPQEAGCSAGVGACGITLTTPLASATQYNWAVRAWNAAGTRGWSASNVIRTP